MVTHFTQGYAGSMDALRVAAARCFGTYKSTFEHRHDDAGERLGVVAQLLRAALQGREGGEGTELGGQPQVVRTSQNKKSKLVLHQNILQKS